MADYKFRCSDAELEAWRAAASSRGVDMSAWVRDSLNDAAVGSPAAKAVGSPPESGENPVGSGAKTADSVGSPSGGVGTRKISPTPRYVATKKGETALQVWVVTKDRIGGFCDADHHGAKLACGKYVLSYSWTHLNRDKVEGAVRHTWGDAAWEKIEEWLREIQRGGAK